MRLMAKLLLLSFATVAISRQARGLNKHLGGNPFLSGPIQWGVVYAVHTSPNTVDIYLDGTQNLGNTKFLTTGVRYLSGFTPTVGSTYPVLRGSHGTSSDRFVLPPLA